MDDMKDDNNDILRNGDTVNRISMTVSEIQQYAASMALDQSLIDLLERMIENPVSGRTLYIEVHNDKRYPIPANEATRPERIKLYEAIRDYMVADRARLYGEIQKLKEKL